MSIRVGIVGVGNCANSLVQGLHYYGRVLREGMVAEAIGLVRPKVANYTVDDIEIVSAFDVADTKVGKELSRAIWAAPNDTFKFATVPATQVIVARGKTLDGIGIYLKNWITESTDPPVDVVRHLQDSRTEVLINYLPVGSEIAARFYATAALAAGCAFINCMPTFIASDPGWAQQFVERGLPIIGDDIKSQVGATIVHRALAMLFRDRGVNLDRTLQLNIGGNGDFLNMLERERLNTKKLSKTNAVVSVAGVKLAPNDVHIGPSDYVSWLGDRKWAYLRLEGRGFGGAPLNIELKMEVWDSPNSAGIVIDAIRCAALALERGDRGPIYEPSAYFMKSPPKQMDDSVALAELERYIMGVNRAPEG